MSILYRLFRRNSGPPLAQPPLLPHLPMEAPLAPLAIPLDMPIQNLEHAAPPSTNLPKASDPGEHSAVTDPLADFPTTSPLEWMRIGFYQALSRPVPATASLDEWIREETAPIRQRQINARAHHESQILAAKAEIARIERDIAQCELQLQAPLPDLTAQQGQLDTYQAAQEGIETRISALRSELVQARAKFIQGGDHGRFASLDQFVASTQTSNSQHIQLTKQAYEDRRPWYEHRKAQLQGQQDLLGERKKSLEEKVMANGFMTGYHIQSLLSIASILACLCGWAMAILAGATSFDDNTILEVFVRQILKSAATWQAEFGWWGRMSFFLGWILLYLLCLGTMYGANWLIQRFFQSSPPAPPSPSKEGDELSPELEIDLGNDSFAWLNRFGPHLIQSLAPAWIILGILMVFMTPSGVSKIAEAENAYSGFIIGFGATWVAGLGGYFLVFQRQSGPSPRWRGWLWLLAGLGAGVLTFGLVWLIAGAADDGFLAIAFSAGVLAFLLVMAAGLVGRTLQIFFTAMEMREIDTRLDRLSLQLSRVLTPWSTMLEYPSSAWMRRHVRAMQEQYGQIRYDWLQMLRVDKWSTSDQGYAEFYDKLLPEYRPIDHIQSAEQVGLIESEKRNLLLLNGKISALRTEIRDIRSLGEGWQQDLRKRLSSLVGTAEDRRRQLLQREREWLLAETAMTAYINQVESYLRRGWDSGTWYLQHPTTLQPNMTWN
jgi:hypothetical protein